MNFDYDTGLGVFGTVTLGALIDRLNVRPREESVRFGFGGFFPTGIASYRGYYEHLAIGFSETKGLETVGALTDVLQAALGKTFDGWKGGSFRMHRETPVWISNLGDCYGTTITGITNCEYQTVLLTGFTE